MKKTTLSCLLKLSAFLILAFITSCSDSGSEIAESNSILQKTNKTAKASAASNAAPSQYLNYDFNYDAIVKMQKIKITESAHTEFFSVHNYTGGYAGLQQTPDTQYGTSNTAIGSLWDPNTAGGIRARVAYSGPGTVASRFGGEGDGAKTINPYRWTLNTWYNYAIRSWKVNGELFIGNFIQNVSTGKWTHISTLAQPERSLFLGINTSTFMENWVGDVYQYDGHLVRKAYFKDCWNLGTNNTWEKHKSRHFVANENDAYRNGIYDRAFNAGFDTTQDAYFMEHGGNVTPNSGFGSGRKLNLPAQTNQGNSPILTLGKVNSITASYSNGVTTVRWVNDETKSPQFSSIVEILNPQGTVIKTVNEILPQKRAATFSGTLGAGTYSVRVTITDIFNQRAAAVTSTVVIGDGGTVTDPTTPTVPTAVWYKIKNVYSGKYLDVANNSTLNSAAIIQANNTANLSSQWKFVAVGSSYVVVNRNSAKAISIKGSSTAAGALIIQSAVANTSNQKWAIVSVGSGKFYFRNNLSNAYVIDVPGSSLNPNVQVISYPFTNNPNQLWVLEKQ